MYKRHLRQFLLLMTSLFLVACSQAPAPAELSQILSRHYQRELGPQAVLVRNLKKSGGIKEDDKHYKVDVHYDLVFLKSFDELANDTEQRSRQGQWLKALNDGLGLWQLHLRFGKFKSGDVVKVDQQLTLIKTDDGWDLAAHWQDKDQ